MVRPHPAVARCRAVRPAGALPVADVESGAIRRAGGRDAARQRARLVISIRLGRGALADGSQSLADARRRARTGSAVRVRPLRCRRIDQPDLRRGQRPGARRAGGDDDVVLGAVCRDWRSGPRPYGLAAAVDRLDAGRRRTEVRGAGNPEGRRHPHVARSGDRRARAGARGARPEAERQTRRQGDSARDRSGIASAVGTVENIPIFRLLEPTSVPSGRGTFRDLPPRLRDVTLAACAGPSRFRSDAETRGLVETALGVAAETPFEVLSPHGRVRPPDQLADDADHDDFFSMERVAGNRPNLFLWSMLHAYRELLDERLEEGTSLPAAEWLQLRYAFESLVRYLLWAPQGPAPDPRDWLVADAARGDALRRWIYGHRVFMALLQGLIVVANDLKLALADNGDGEAKAAFDVAAALLLGSARGFRFATDFSRAAYEHEVRPSMMPPRAVPGLSGALSQDHARLMKTMAALKPDFAVLKPALRPWYARFREAFQVSFDDHTLVCERCVGDRQPSLLMAMANLEVRSEEHTSELQSQSNL